MGKEKDDVAQCGWLLEIHHSFSLGCVVVFDTGFLSGQMDDRSGYLGGDGSGNDGTGSARRDDGFALDFLSDGPVRKVETTPLDPSISFFTRTFRHSSLLDGDAVFGGGVRSSGSVQGGTGMDLVGSHRGNGVEFPGSGCISHKIFSKNVPSWGECPLSASGEAEW